MDSSSSSSHMDEDSVDGSEREFEYDLDEVDDEEAAEEDDDEDANEYDEEEEEEDDDEEEIGMQRDLSATLSGVVNQFRLLHRPQAGSADGFPEVSIDPGSVQRLHGLPHGIIGFNVDQAGLHVQDAEAILSTAWDAARHGTGPPGMSGITFDPLLALPSRMRYGGHGFGIPSGQHAISAFHALEPAERVHPVLRRRRHTANFGSHLPSYRLQGNLPRLLDPSNPDPCPSRSVIMDTAGRFMDVIRQSRETSAEAEQAPSESGVDIAGADLVSSSRPSVPSLPQAVIAQDVSQSVGVQTVLPQSSATALTALPDSSIGTLDASMNSRVSAVLGRRYDPNDPTDDQGAEFAALAEAGLLTGQREVSVPTRTSSVFSFLSKPNKDEAPHLLEIRQHWSYDPRMDSSDERWLTASAGRSQSREQHPLRLSALSTSGGGSQGGRGTGMDLLRDEVVKRLEQVLRLSRDAHAKVQKFQDDQKNEQSAKLAAKQAADLEELENLENNPDASLSDEREGVETPDETRDLSTGSERRPSDQDSSAADVRSDRAGVETELDHSTLDGARSSMAPNAIVESVPSNVQALGAGAGDGSEAEATHSPDGVAATPLVQSGNDDIAQLVEERAAAAGISLDAPASEDPDVVAAALASTGIDPTFLAALPDEMRGEVLTQMFQQLASSHPTDVGQEATSSTILSQDFLIALPPALRAEVLQQEATFRARTNLGNAGNDAAQGDNQDSQAADTGAETLGGLSSQGRGPSDTDAATVLATMPRELREEIFLTSAESFLESLPSHMAAEARAVRERVMGHMSRGWRQPPDLGIMQFGELVVPARTFRAEEDQPSERRQPQTSWACNDGKWMRLAPPADKEPPALCGNSALASLVNLLQLHSSQFGKTLLYHVLAHLCKKASARRQILDLLFYTVEQKRSVQTQTSRTSNLAKKGDVTASTSLEVPVQEISVPVDIEYATCAVVVRRALELLTNLCKNESILAESIVMVPEAHTHVPDDDECCSLTVDGFSPVTRLIGLLSEPLFQRSSAHQEQLLLLLATVCGAIPEASVPSSAVVYTGRPAIAGELDTVVAPEHTVDISDIANAVAEPSTTMTPVQPPERDSDADSDSVTDTDGEISASANDRSKSVDCVTVPVQSRVPALRADHVCALTNILLQEGPSDRTHQRATNVLGQFGMLPGNRRLALEALSDCASRLASSVSTAFKSFVTALPPGKVADTPARASAIQEFSMMASADELKFLRVVKAISVLVKGLPVGDFSVEADSGEMSWLEISRMGYVHCVGDLWSSLDAVLCAVHEQHPANLERNANDSSVSARDSVDALANAVVSTINGGSSSRLGGKVHSLAPVLARLSPVIESFFVYHGPACPDGNQDISKDVDKSKPRSEPDPAYFPSSPGRMNTQFDGQRSLISCERELGTFIERHRIALNAILRVNPQLLDGSFRPALRHAHAIDFDNKKAYFRALIRKRSSEAHAGTIRITVRRDRVFDDSYHQLRSHSAEEMKGRLHVQFNGEEGIDAGGVTREWYVILARQIFDPNYALFCRSAAKAATYQPNKASAINREHLDNFRFVGRIFGKAIYDGQLLDAYFTRAFYKHILGIKPTYHDIEAEDPEYYKSLCWILENDITDIIDETFSTEFEEFGQQHIVDLKPNGRNVQVTEENKEEYVRLVTEVKLTKAISMQIASFKEGFHELIPLEDCRIFNEVELELLTSGLPDIDVADLKANVEYTGYTPGSPQINWFWTAVSRMGQEDLARLVMFVTGTSKVPLEGFSALQGMNGPQKFQIHRASGGKDRLPSAHTCFNQLDLPEYDSCDTLSERLLRAVRETEGFGFA